MNTTLPAGVVAIETQELDHISGGGIWRLVAGAATAGFTAGRWLACAVLCLGDL